jgi:hypothetical protein
VSPRLFELVRHVDVSKVSGVGTVAEGAIFSDGSVALRWLGQHPATAVFISLEWVLAVHGHNGATVVRYLDETEPAPTNGRSAWECHDDPEMTR